MRNNRLIYDIKFSILLLISLFISQLVSAANDDSMVIYEAENLTLNNFIVAPNKGAFNDSIITLYNDYGTAILTSKFSGNYDLQLTYQLEGEGNCIFEVYIDDDLVDSWLAKQYGGVYTNDTLNRVFHLSQNIVLERNNTIEIVGYTSEGEHCKIDRLGISVTAVDDSQCNLTWNTDGSMKSLSLKGSNYLNTSKSSGVELVVSEGVKLTTSSVDRVEENGQNVQLIKESSYTARSFSFRVERYPHHIKLRLLNMEGIPKRDRSLGLQMVIPFTSEIGFEVLDDQIVVEKNSNTLTVYWTKLASRGVIPGGFIALYAESDKTAARNEIFSTEELEIPTASAAPTDISLSSDQIMENNSIGEIVGIFSTVDPQGDIASYMLIEGDGDIDNSSVTIVGDTLKANSVFDYEADSLVHIRVQVTDSASNSFEKTFVLAVGDDESDNGTGIQNDSDLQKISIYPNPTNSLLYITRDKDCFIEIYNVIGIPVYNGWHIVPY